MTGSRKTTKVVTKARPGTKEDQDGGGAADQEAVAPLDPKAFQLVMSIIDNAQIRGGDAGNIIQLRMELARVANVRRQESPGSRQ